MKIIKNLKQISLAVALALPTSYINAKTYNPDLAIAVANADDPTNVTTKRLAAFA